MEPTELAVLGLVGFFSGTVNTMAGGGSLITLPALILLGLPASVANGTNRVGVLVQSLAATWRFHAEGELAWRHGVLLLAPTCVGSVIGAWASTLLPDAAFQQIIGVAMLLMLGLIWVRPRRWLEGAAEVQAPGPARMIAFFGIGLYGGFLQAGVGIMLLIALVLMEGFDLVRANGIKVLLVFGFTVPPLLIFVHADLVDWVPGLVLAGASSIGAWVGTKLTLERGPVFVRRVLIVVVLASAAKLLVS